MANGYSIFVGLVVIAAMCVAAWFFSPKGENQVYVFFPFHPPSFPSLLPSLVSFLDWESH